MKRAHFVQAQGSMGFAHTIGKAVRMLGLASLVIYFVGWVVALAGLALQQQWCGPAAAVQQRNSRSTLHTARAHCFWRPSRSCNGSKHAHLMLPHPEVCNCEDAPKSHAPDLLCWAVASATTLRATWTCVARARVCDAR